MKKKMPMMKTMTPRQRRELVAEWACAGAEPSLASVMNDPIIQLLARSAGLTADEFGHFVNDARQGVRNRVRRDGIRKTTTLKGVELPVRNGIVGREPLSQQLAGVLAGQSGGGHRISKERRRFVRGSL